MNGGPGAPTSSSDGLLVGSGSVIHRLPAHAKLLALLGFVLVVVATPTGALAGVPLDVLFGWRVWWPFAAYLLLLLAAAALARLPAGIVLRRSAVELPFLVFAAAMPFVATGELVALGPVTVSAAGLVGGATLAAKATLGVLAAVVLASTTASRDLLAALERLRLPATLVAIASFMLRYAAVLTADLRRMRIARESRGAASGRAGHLAAAAGSAGVLFVRSYERGERVHLAMLARGYDGRMPSLADLAPADVATPGATPDLATPGATPGLAAPGTTGPAGEPARVARGERSAYTRLLALPSPFALPLVLPLAALAVLAASRVMAG